MNINMKKQPIVIDTNILISAILSPKSITALVVRKALIDYELHLSQATFNEFCAVIQRDKFKKYLAHRVDECDKFIKDLVDFSIFIEPIYTVMDCKDPKDNMFLELALTCNAVYLVTGDKKDLISMTPYNGIEIITATEFLERQS